MTGIKKVYKWVIRILAAIGAFFVLIKTRDPSKIAIEFERVKLENEIKQAEIKQQKVTNENELTELDKKLTELKKRKKDLAERLKKLTIGALIFVIMLSCPGNVVAQQESYDQLLDAYNQLQKDYLEAIELAEELMALIEDLEVLAEKYRNLYLETNEELTKSLEVSQELMEWSNKLQQELLKATKKRFGLSGGVLYHMNAPGLWTGITISF